MKRSLVTISCALCVSHAMQGAFAQEFTPAIIGRATQLRLLRPMVAKWAVPAYGSSALRVPSGRQPVPVCRLDES